MSVVNSSVWLRILRWVLVRPTTENETVYWIRKPEEWEDLRREHAREMRALRDPWPTAHEFSTALEKAQYDKTNFHIAIVGKTGCGRSSLINAFLNLKPTDSGAAPTGVTETTLEMKRYSDPGTQPPRPWTVWYDIPGAGTQRIPHFQYFTNQALFIFDIILLVIGDRVEETDCAIIQSCLKFNIPFIIIRSKADQHIMNMMRDQDEDYSGPSNSGGLYNECRQMFINES